jgi:hypothetical protein
VQTPPTHPDEGLLATTLAEQFALEAATIRYAPVGFGSHHWIATSSSGDRFFVTVDDLDQKARSRSGSIAGAFTRLDAALTTAAILLDGGCEFVVAPLVSRDGHRLIRLDRRHAVAVYPYLDGRIHVWGAELASADRAVLLEHLDQLHTAELIDDALVDDFEPAHRRELDEALGHLDDRWETGPYAETARGLLARHVDRIHGLLDRHAELVEPARAHPERMVLTHGEPHIANWILTESGWRLVDWDTVLIAPPERDLWLLQDPAVTVDATSIEGAATELYRTWCGLADLAAFVALFRRPHQATADTRTAWEALSRYLDGG